MVLKISYLFEIFSVSLKERVIDPLPAINQTLEKHYREFISKLVDRKTFNLFEDTLKDRRRILKNAQNGWVSKSEIEFHQMQKKYSESSMVESLSLLLISQDAPLIAFIEYQKSNYERAASDINQAIEADFKLESLYEFHEIVFHRIHLMHNLAKIYIKKNERMHAIPILAKLLYALAFHQENSLQPPIVINSNLIDIEYKSILFQNICDTFSVLYKEMQYGVLEFFNPLPVIPDVSTSIDRRYFNILKLCENPQLTNLSFEDILKGNAQQYGGFWYTAVAILHQWCEENETFYATKIIEQLQLEKCPSYWLQFVKSWSK